MQLREKEFETSMELFIVSQEKTQLAHKLKRVGGSTSVVGRATKRSRVEDNSISFEDHQKVVAEIEKKFKQKCRDCEILRASKAKMEKRYKAKVEELEKQLLAKGAQFEEENTQRLVVETQLKGSNIHLE